MQYANDPNLSSAAKIEYAVVFAHKIAVFGMHGN